ncbi:MAG: hypothetical protein M1829_001459 [Trizodia sp. TS-e1964]|nr:MAG: hypothetical protein M1829_001459 [Trizodia sp. TS-e1964]
MRPDDEQQARLALNASLSAVGHSIDAELRSRAINLHSNSRALSAQEASLAAQTAALAKQNAQWQKLADSGTSKLKEMGDIENWAEMIERDLAQVEETMRLVDERGQEGQRRD